MKIREMFMLQVNLIIRWQRIFTILIKADATQKQTEREQTNWHHRVTLYVVLVIIFVYWKIQWNKYWCNDHKQEKKNRSIYRGKKKVELRRGTEFLCVHVTDESAGARDETWQDNSKQNSCEINNRMCTECILIIVQ